MTKSFHLKIFDELSSKISNSSDSSHRMLLFIIIALGFALRIHGLIVGEGFREFSIKDELAAYSYALSFLDGNPGSWYLGQPEFSGGQAPGPLWTLFWVALYKLGGSTPDGAMFWMITVSSFVIYLVYRFSHTLHGRNYALLTALLYATGAWPMFYSAILWNPIPMALIGILLFITLWQTTQNDHSRSIFLVCLISAIIPQFHMIGLFYYPAILLILILSPAKLNSKWFVLGILAGLGIYLPYLIGDYLNNWQNTSSMVGKDLPASYGVGKIIITPIGVLSNQIARWTGYGFENYREFGNAYFGSYIILVLVNVVSLILSIVFISSFLKKSFSVMSGHWLSPAGIYKQYPAQLFIAIFLLVPPLLFLFTGHNYGSRYTIFIFPLLFLLPAFFLKMQTNVGIKQITGLLLGFMVVFNCYLYLVFNHHISDRIENADYYAPSFRKLEDTRQQIRQNIGSDSYIKVIADDYINAGPEEMYTGGISLSTYISITENHLSHRVRPEKTTTLHLIPASKTLPDNARLIYQTNGMAVIQRQ